MPYKGLVTVGFSSALCHFTQGSPWTWYDVIPLKDAYEDFCTEWSIGKELQMSLAG